MADPKVVEDPQAGAGVDPQAGNTGAGAGESQADEPISLEKAKELRAENKNLRDRAKALEAEKAQRDADARKAAEQKAKDEGRLADVLKERDDELARLQPRAELADTLEKLFTDQFAAESKEWDESVKALIPESLDAQIAMWPKLRAAQAKVSSTTGSARPGNGRDPKPAGALTPAAALEAKKAELRRQGGYGRF